MKAKKIFIWAVVFFLPLFLVLAPKTLINKGIAAENECVNCHTNLKKLMDLSWEVKKIKPKQELSKEISGEG
ncbi:MAG: hypothetical protein KAV87_58775 [Desulfobacteraceae bacterium]|nr:hypothetical protein [Desulfobacteraceae bacterium]